MSRWILAVVVGGLLLAACTTGDEKQAGDRPSAATSKPDDKSARKEKDEKWPLRRASSESIALGVETRFKLYTHCGVDWMVDFDGSFWDAIAEEQAIDNGDYRSLGNPSDRGTMTLVSADRALYESDTGATIDYSRAGESRRSSPCY